MLAEQVYDDHVSIHDDATAKRLGFQGGAIEGPTHFSQFAPLGERLWAEAWFETGCLSAHYRNPAFEGEDVQAVMAKPPAGARETEIRMVKRDGAEVLRGTASVAGAEGPTALERRLAEGLPSLQDPVILADVKIGMKTARQRVRMDFDQNMGVRGPAVGLFADQEMRLVEGPLFVAEDYELEREVVAMSASRRTESLWVRTSVTRPGSDRVVALMLLNLASLKNSYAPYAAEHAALYGRERSDG